MPTLLAYFGINSSGLNLAIDLLIVFLVVLYLSLVYWTYADARRRILDPILVLCAVVASLFPFVGPVVYIILRPPEYLEDVRERELEVQAAELRLQELEQTLCPHCDHHVERDFLRCPSCLRKLREPCPQCRRPLEPTWTLCPYCEADRPSPAKAKRAARKRERAPEPALDPGPARGASPPAPARSTHPPAPARGASPPAPARGAHQPAPARSASPPAPASARRGRTATELELEHETPTDESEPWTAH